jgi:hypothetical protein
MYISDYHDAGSHALVLVIVALYAAPLAGIVLPP